MKVLITVWNENTFQVFLVVFWNGEALEIVTLIVITDLSIRPKNKHLNEIGVLMKAL